MIKPRPSSKNIYRLIEMSLNVTKNITYLLFDVLAFVAVEVVTKYWFSSTHITRKDGHRSSKVQLLIAQAVILIAFVALFYLHHFAYLLVVVTCAIVIRIVFILCKERSTGNTFLSTPLQYAQKASKHVPVSWDSHHHKLAPQSHVSPSRKINALPPEEPFAYTTSSTSSEIPVVPSQTEKLPKQRRPVNIQSGLSSSLQRSHIKPASNSTSTLHPIDHTHSFPPYRKDSTLSYFGSMFNFRSRPSVTPPGLVNSGNTCFINSILQCLTWMPGFLNSLESVNTERRVFFSVLSRVLDQCHAVPDGNSRYESIRTTDLLRVISEMAPHLVTKNGMVTYQTQQDTAEFLLWLLNHVHNELSSGGIKKETNVSEFNSDLSSLTAYKDASQSELNGIKSSDPTFNNKLFRYSDIDWKLNRKQADSAIYDQFLGQLLEARECQMCQKVSLNIEYFMVLPLPLPTVNQTNEVYSLADCFSLFSQVEDLVQSNMITCSCLLPNEEVFTPGKRRALISKPPKNLIIQLTRYSYDSNTQSSMKNKVCVQFPTSLNLPCTLQSELGSEQSSTQILYSLTGVCVHSGADSTANGHYVAYCRAGASWYYFNDEDVEMIPDIEEELRTYFVLRNAYLLFYSQV